MTQRERERERLRGGREAHTEKGNCVNTAKLNVNVIVKRHTCWRKYEAEM